MPSLTLECRSITTTSLPDGRLRVELHEPVETGAFGPNTRHTKDAAARRLTDLTGQPVSIATVDRWMRRRVRPLPFHKPGGRPIFIEQELRDWVANGDCTPSLL